MLLLLFLFGLALGAVPPSDDQPFKLQRANCPMFWYSFNGRCYKYVSTRLTWADAEFHCLSQGANLVSIHNVNEQNFLTSLIFNFDPAQGFTWIGISDTQKEGGWMWSDGCGANFVFWRAGQPDNIGRQEHCGHTNSGTTLKWNDISCTEKFAFVCASRVMCP